MLGEKEGGEEEEGLAPHDFIVAEVI
jgi:hypothetical protein